MSILVDMGIDLKSCFKVVEFGRFKSILGLLTFVLSNRFECYFAKGTPCLGVFIFRQTFFSIRTSNHIDSAPGTSSILIPINNPEKK